MINLTVNLSGLPDEIAEDFIPYWRTFLAESIIPLTAILISVLFFCYLCCEMYANEGGIHYVAIERAPLTMRKVLNPFSFVVNTQRAGSSDVLCTLSTTRTCHVLPFWGVPLSALFEVLRLHDWISIKHAFSEDNTSFKNKCLASSPSIRLNSGRQEMLSFRPPPSLYDDVDPRLFLPLVVVMVVEEHEDIVENIEQPIVCVQIVIVHVPSLLENTRIGSLRNPSVVGIYVKEAHSSTIGSIKKIYDGSSHSENLNGEEIPVCVACCQRRVNTVILPCLHASLCTLCYLRCEVCPSCRGPAFYHFTTGPIVEIPQESI